MKFSHVLESRRSIRRFKDEPIEKEDIKKILKAASLAPSWKNSQCPRWYVITNDLLLAQIRENALPEFNARNCAKAPCLIVAAFETGHSGRMPDGSFANECEEGWSYFDLGLAVENLLLEASRLAYGTLVMGIRNGEVLRQILSVPADQQVVAVIALGKPDIDPHMPVRHKLKETTVFFD